MTTFTLSPARPATPPGFVLDRKTAVLRVVFSGDFTVHSLGRLDQALQAALADAAGPVAFDLAQVTAMDTAGALLLNRAAADLRGRGLTCALEQLSEAQAGLLAKALPAPGEKSAAAPPAPAVLRGLETVGREVCENVNLIGQLISFFGQFLITAGKLLFHPSRMRWTSLVFHMEQVGLRAVPIISLLTFLIGLVVAYMGAQQLSMFGADIFAVNLLEVTVTREMAVLITSIVVAGRSSSSFTAQIGSMVANEEVAAMRSMGLDPSVLLVAPRVLALALCLPMLVFLADIMALFGGAVAIWICIDLNFYAFLTQLQEVAKPNNFLVGMIKTPFFALSIGLVGCFQGFRATGSAESVGFLTTLSVVQSIFIVILLDALFAVFFTNIGL